MKWFAPKGQAEEMLRCAGYYPHKNGHMNGGWIFDVPPHRWHAKTKGSMIDLHWDKTINYHHNARFWGQYVRQEHLRICAAFYAIHPKVDHWKPVIAPNVESLQKTKVKVRSLWNPLRYFLGKFIYIDSQRSVK